MTDDAFAYAVARGAFLFAALMMLTVIPLMGVAMLRMAIWGRW